MTTKSRYAHTPGGWSIYKDQGAQFEGWFIANEDKMLVAYVYGNPTDGVTRLPQGPEFLANARLIAAAPQLLAALRRLAYETESRAGAPKVFIAAAHAAIAAALERPVN
jgi:hypothetical protein